MTIKMRGLNPNETYCCTKRDLKAVFKETDIDVYFGYSISRQEMQNNKTYRIDKKNNDRIAVSMMVGKKRELPEGITMGASLRFFILDKNSFTEKNREIFRAKVLPKLYDIYQEHKDECDMINGLFCVVVGLSNSGEYNYYETRHFAKR